MQKKITILTYEKYNVKNVNLFGRNWNYSDICGVERSIDTKKAELLISDIQLLFIMNINHYCIFKYLLIIL